MKEHLILAINPGSTSTKLAIFQNENQLFKKTMHHEKEQLATKLERDVEDLKKAEYMQDKIGKEYKGIISSVTEFGLFVELENTIEGLIKFENLGNDYYIYNEERKTLAGEKTKEIFTIGDKIKVKILEANKSTRKIEFKRVI